MTLTLQSKPTEGFEMWFIETFSEPDSQGKDAVQFKLEGSDDGDAWHVVGSSKSVNYYSRIVYTHGVANVPLERGVVYILNATKSFAHMFSTYTGFTLMLAVLGIVISAMLNKARLARYIIVWLCPVQGLMRTIIGILFCFSSDSDDLHIHTVRLFGSAAGFLLFGAVLSHQEEFLEVALLVLGLFHIIVQAYVYRSLFGESLSVTKYGMGSMFYGIFFSVCGGGFMIARLYWIRKALVGILPAKVRYDSVWAKVLEREGEDVQTLGALIARIQQASGGKKARQLNRRTTPRRKTSVLWMKQKVHPKIEDFGSDTPHAIEKGETSPHVAIDKQLANVSSTTLFNRKQRGSDASASDSNKHRRRFSSLGALFSDGSGAEASITHGSNLIFPAPDSPSIASRDGSSRKARSIKPHHPFAWSYLALNVLQTKQLADILKMRWTPQYVLRDPVMTLDQLHSQASLVQDLFFEIVVDLARPCGGKFLLKSETEASKMEFRVWSAEQRDKFSLGQVKSLTSCVSKLDRAYNRDVSRLLDLCRETIYFDTVSQLHACLESLSQDPRIEIAQVKSTMGVSDQVDSGVIGGSLSSGMKFVGVYVRLRGSVEAQSLCVDTHVCELLLVLTDIAAIALSPETKKTYQDWRKVKRVVAFFSKAFHRIKQGIHSRQRQQSIASVLRDPAIAKSSMHGGGFEVGPNACMHGIGPQQRSQPAFAESFSHLEPPSISNQIQGQIQGAEEQGAGRPVKTQFDESEGGRAIEKVNSEIEMEKDESGGEAAALKALSQGSDSQSLSSGETSFGFTLSTEMIELLEGICCMTTLGLGDFLDRRWKKVLLGVDQRIFSSSSFSGLFFASHRPMTAAFHFWSMRVCLILLALWWLFVSVVQITLYVGPAPSFPAYQHYRLETMLTRSGIEGGEIAGPGVSVFGVLGSSWCTPNAVPANALAFDDEWSDDVLQPSFSAPVGSSFVTSYPRPRSFSGWYLHTGSEQGSEGDDPSYHIVWATNQAFKMGNLSCALPRTEGRWWEGGDKEIWCGVEWIRIGTPAWTWAPPSFGTKDNFVWLQLPFELSEQRASLQKFLLTPSPLFVVAHIIPQFVGTTGCFMALLISRLKSRKRFSFLPDPPTVIAYVFCLSGISFLAASVAYFAVNDLYEALPNLFRGLMCAITSLFVNSNKIVHALCVGAFLDIGGYLGSKIFIYRMPHSYTPGFPFIGLVWIFFACAVAALRFRALMVSKWFLRQDQKEYDQMWETLCVNEDNKAGLEHLEKVVRMIGLEDINVCKQHNRMLVHRLPKPVREKWFAQTTEQHMAMVNPILQEIQAWFIPGRPDPKSQVWSITQLYLQAAVANLLLRSRLKEWSSRSNGMLLHLDEEEEAFVMWNDLKDDPEKRDNVHWTMMKGHDRAFEKLVRSYGNKTSSLVDIVRCCLVFKSMEHLTNCLGIIATDEHVRVERLKNRLSLSYDSDETGGYRDVCINLKIVSKEAQFLGVELHQCEVQLILEDFANIKNSGRGHRSYVLARNAKCN